MLQAENKIVSKIFSQEEISEIYRHIDATPEDKKYYHTDFAHTAYFSWLPERIVEKITKVANENYDAKLVLRELSFARYENTKGLNPLLYPHYDRAFKQQRITFDIQVRSTRPWDIIVEDVPFTLKDNEALFFSGTHQIHWRDKVEFEDGDIVDMIFCHFAEPDAVALTPDHLAAMDTIEKKYLDSYYN